MQRILILIILLFVTSTVTNANEQTNDFAKKFSPGEYTSQENKNFGFAYTYFGYNYQNCILVFHYFGLHSVKPNRSGYRAVNIDLSRIDPKKNSISGAVGENGIVGIDMPYTDAEQSEQEHISQLYSNLRKLGLERGERNQVTYEVFENGVDGHKLRNFNASMAGTGRPF